MNTTVVGPIDLADWRTMRSMLRAINYYKQRNDPKFDYALETETKLYSTYRDKYVADNDNQPSEEVAA